jgi:hypothetical protein
LERQSRTSLCQTIAGGIPRPPTPSEGVLARPPSLGSTHLHPSQISSGHTTSRSCRSSQRSLRKSSRQTSCHPTPLTTQQLPLVPPEPIEVEVPEQLEEVPNPQELNQYWGNLIECLLTRPPRDPLKPSHFATTRTTSHPDAPAWSPSDLANFAQEQVLLEAK